MKFLVQVHDVLIDTSTTTAACLKTSNGMSVITNHTAAQCFHNLDCFIQTGKIHWPISVLELRTIDLCHAAMLGREQISFPEPLIAMETSSRGGKGMFSIPRNSIWPPCVKSNNMQENQ